MKDFPVSKTYRLIEPGPVVLVTTLNGGRPNIMTMGFHMMVQHPSLIGAVIGPWDYSYEALSSTGECVICIPTVDLAAKVVDIGNCSGREIDKFKKFGLNAAPGKKVKAPLIRECLANIECKVADTSLADRYSLFILQAGDGTFSVDGRVLDLRKKMVLWKQFQD